MKVTIAFETCNCEVTGEYHPAEWEDGFLFAGAEFYVEDFTLDFEDGLKVSLDDLPVGMVDSKFFDELEQRCIDKIEGRVMTNELMLTDNGYRQLMKHACRLAQDGHGELAQHLRDAIDLRARLDAAPAVPQQAEPVGYFVNDESDDQWHQVDYEQRNGADTYPLYLHPPAVPQQAEPVAWPAGHRWARNIAALESQSESDPTTPIIAPQQAEPVAQIGWSDEFGNLFPMGAWKPAQRTHHDSHKTSWRPVFLHPPAAEVQRLREALEYLIEKCGDSDDAQYSTLGTKFVRDIARRALEGSGDERTDQNRA